MISWVKYWVFIISISYGQLDPGQISQRVSSEPPRFVCGNITLLFFMKIFEYLDCNVNNFSRSMALAWPQPLCSTTSDVHRPLSLMLMTMAFYYNLTNSRKRLFACSLGAVLTRQNQHSVVGVSGVLQNNLRTKTVCSPTTKHSLHNWPQ